MTPSTNPQQPNPDWNKPSTVKGLNLSKLPASESNLSPIGQQPESIDEEWEAHRKTIFEYCADKDQQLRHIIQYARSGEFYPADMHVQLIKEVMSNTSPINVQLNMSTEGQQPVDNELANIRRDIIAAVANDYYEQLKNDAPYINMKFEELGAVCRDFATKDVDELTAYADRRADKRVEEASIKSEIKGKIEALDKMIMGAGEYHDDPYEYVVRLSDLREYRAELAQFDLSQPVFRDDTHHPKGGSNAL